MYKIDDILGFGKYKGLTIREIWCGPIIDDKKVIIDYLNTFLRFVRKDYDYNYSFLTPPLSSENNENSNLKKKLTISNFNNIISNKYIIIESEDENTISHIGKILQFFYKNNFSEGNNSKLLINDHSIKRNIAIESLKINSNPGYILWCIRNLNHFYIEDIEELLLLPSNDLVKIDIKQINLGLFDYYPTYKSFQCNIKQEIIDINNNKYMGFSNIEKNTQTYEEFNGSYAQDIMGFSDQVINDAFDGDPDVYWNID